MVKKNKACRNAFFFFMMELKSSQGRNYKTMEEVSAAADPLWKNMSMQQRKKYEDMAKREKGSAKEKKLTSLGQNIDDIRKKEDETTRKERLIKQETLQTVQVLKQTDELANHYFYIIHINEFCYCTNYRMHVPAEIACARFNLQSGVLPEDVFHYVIKPGPLPLGYASAAKQTADETHQLPLPPPEDSGDNLAEVFTELKKYLKAKPQGAQGEFPPVYTRDKDLYLIIEILQQFCDDLCNGSNSFKVRSLEYLLFVLRNECAGKQVWPTKSLSLIELEKDVYDYSPRIMCAYHEHTDTPIHCSKSIVTRLAYIICDNCCADLDIQLIRGQHVPAQARVEGSTWSSRAPSEATIRPSIISSRSYTTTTSQELGGSEYLGSDEEEDNFRNSDIGAADLPISTTNPDVGKAEFPALSREDDSQDYTNDIWQLAKQKGGRDHSYASMAGTSGSVQSSQSSGRSRRPMKLPSALLQEVENINIGGAKPKGRGRGISSRYPTKN